jgi:hypothetical protein
MNKESVFCLELTEKWLTDPASVSAQELYTASASAASTASAHASAAAYTAAASAHASASAASAYASASASASAHAAYTAVFASKEEKLDQYKNHLKGMIKSLTKLEKVIYEIA